MLTKQSAVDSAWANADTWPPLQDFQDQATIDEMVDNDICPLCEALRYAIPFGVVALVALASMCWLVLEMAGV